MKITEERLSEVLGRAEPGAHLADAHPAAALIVESAAAADPQYADGVREAGRFLCDLLWPPDGSGGPTLTLPVAMHTYAREEHTAPADMWAHLGQTSRSDPLLGLATQALLRQPSGSRRRRQPPGDLEREAVLRAVYLLVRMYENQESTEALERALEA